MSRRRLAFMVTLCVLCAGWSVYALIGQSLRLTHRATLAMIRAGEAIPAPAITAHAIADYRHALGFAPCNRLLHEDLALLLAARLDDALDTTDIVREDAAFKEIEDALAARLACMPRDGKAWLDLATIIAYREGLSPRVMAAYRHSAQVSPGESWLAEQRLVFALTLQPLMGQAERAVAHADIAVLERAHPNRINAILREAQLPSVDALTHYFAAKTPQPDTR